MAYRITLDEQVHELHTDHSTLLDGFAVFCPVCDRVWVSMQPIIRCAGQVGFIRYIKAACPAHGGSLLELFGNDGVVMLPLRYGYMPRAALEQIVLSAGD